MDKSVVNKEKKHDRLWAVLLPPAALCFLWIIYSPLELLFGNETELSYNMYTLLGYMLPVFIIATLCMAGLLGLALKKSTTAFRICTAIITGILAASYIEGTFLSGNLPPLDGRNIEWASYKKEALISGTVWCAALIAAFTAAFRIKTGQWKKIVTALSSVMILILGIVIMITCISTGGYHRQNGILQSDTYILDMSEDENMVLLLLDSVDGVGFREVTEKHPEYREILEDFTSFENVMSGYPYTSRSVPFILTGKWYENEQPYMDYCIEAFTDSPLFAKLKREGYRMGFYDPAYSFILSFEDMFENISKAPFFASPLRFVRLQLKLTGYRYFPFFLKQSCTVTPSEISEDTLRSNGIEGNYTWENEHFLDKLETRDIKVSDEKCFRYIYLAGAHVPFTYPAQADGIEDCSYESSIELCMTLIERYLNKLKESGVYDNTAIVILADHGYADNSNSEGRQNPFLLIKGRGEKHPFAVNNAPVSHEDLQEAFSRLIDGKQSSEVFPWEEGSERSRRFLYFWYGGEDTMKEYYQTGSADCEETMTASGRVFILGGN